MLTVLLHQAGSLGRRTMNTRRAIAAVDWVVEYSMVFPMAGWVNSTRVRRVDFTGAWPFLIVT